MGFHFRISFSINLSLFATLFQWYVRSYVFIEMLHIFWDYTSCPLRKSAESPTEIKNAFLKIAKDLDLPASSYTALKINIFSRNPKIDSSKNQSWDMLNEWRTAVSTRTMDDEH